MEFTTNIIAAYGAAVIGFLFVEMLKVGGRKPRTKFVLGYYLRENWENLVLNVLASIGMLLGLSEIGRLEQKYLGDNYVVLTGFGIGLLGSWLLRAIVDSAKRRIPSFLGGEEEQKQKDQH